MALSGTGRLIPSLSTWTSKLYPWLRPQPAFFPTVVSSEEIQVRQGVLPPAQLVEVPGEAGELLHQLARPLANTRTSSVVFPPGPFSSYASAAEWR